MLIEQVTPVGIQSLGRTLDHHGVAVSRVALTYPIALAAGR